MTTPPSSSKITPLVVITPCKVLIFIGVTAVTCGLDLWSKHWAQTTLYYEPRSTITLVENYAAFSYVRNHGAAWGFLSNASERFRKPFFFVVSILATLFILFLYARLESKQWISMLSLTLILGGALGNFIDRLQNGYVVDFIDLHYQQSFRWPTFNVADIGITVGVILLL